MRRIIGAALVTAVAVGGDQARAQGVSPGIRAEGVGVRELIDRGMMGSETFRSLASKLDSSSVIVYVRFSPCSRGIPACLLWASATADARRLLIKIDRFGRSPNELTGYWRTNFNTQPKSPPMRMSGT